MDKREKKMAELNKKFRELDEEKQQKLLNEVSNSFLTHSAEEFGFDLPLQYILISQMKDELEKNIVQTGDSSVISHMLIINKQHLKNSKNTMSKIPNIRDIELNLSLQKICQKK